MIWILADENVDKPVVGSSAPGRLRSGLHVGDCSRDRKWGSLGDGPKEKAILLTADKDFGELVRFSSLWRGSSSKGVVLLRLPGLPPVRKAKLVVEFFREHGDRILEKFVVLTPQAVRIRPLGPE